MLLFFASDLLYLLSPKKTKTILIIKIDEIGDYILFRNFLEIVKNSNKYLEYQITLCANIVLKDVAIIFDQPFVKKFIFLDKKKFSSSAIYRTIFLMKMRVRHYNAVIAPSYSRDFFVHDEIVKHTKAKEKIGFDGDMIKTNEIRKKQSNQYYSTLYQSPNKYLFEFLRNKEFFSLLLNQTVYLDKPYLNAGVEKGNYLIVFPGASVSYRRWSEANFARLIKKLSSKYSHKIVIAGSNSDKSISKSITSRVANVSIENLVGKTSLAQLINLISGASLLISNETSAAHIAVAVNTPTVCISNGNHYMRFAPYPKDIYDKIITLFPDEIMRANNNNKIAEKYSVKSDLNINKVSVNQVYQAVSTLL